MSIKYHVVKKKDNIHPEAKDKYYPQARSKTYVTTKDLLSDMVQHTSLSRMEAATGISYLFEAISKYLKMGITVRLDEFGYVRTTLRCEGSDTPEEVTADKIKSVGLNFVFSRNYIRDFNRSVSFEKDTPRKKKDDSAVAGGSEPLGPESENGKSEL